MCPKASPPGLGKPAPAPIYRHDGRWILPPGMAAMVRTMRASAVPVLLCCAVSACASGAAQPPAVAGGGSVAVVDHIQGTPAMLHRISVVACAPDIGSPTPSAGDALPLLKEKAAAIGATGILRAEYRQAGLLDGCGLVPALRATGIAFRLAQ